ncbi:hypothetical protein RRG08_027964 [Elysia crispata]|uniref:Uncharacterized protein n=1 Tax=Elysia crispata TaxID=231223 RepID=A0AAE0ZK89_9GAST|nr:hypothetical protein RRG08_027964 [Elysia crispata]
MANRKPVIIRVENSQRKNTPALKIETKAPFPGQLQYPLPGGTSYFPPGFLLTTCRWSLQLLDHVEWERTRKGGPGREGVTDTSRQFEGFPRYQHLDQKQTSDVGLSDRVQQQ